MKVTNLDYAPKQILASSKYQAFTEMTTKDVAVGDLWVVNGVATGVVFGDVTGLPADGSDSAPVSVLREGWLLKSAFPDITDTQVAQLEAKGLRFRENVNAAPASSAANGGKQTPADSAGSSAANSAANGQ